MSDESSRPSSFFSSLRNLGWPLILGLGAYIGFNVAIKQGTLTSPFVLRYFASHPVSHAVTAMFLVGLAALILKAFEVLAQYDAMGRVELGDDAENGQSVDDAEQALNKLRALPRRLHNSYLWRRLHDALQYIFRKRHAEGLDDELKYLADQDVTRQHESYSLVRILIWAIPMLGFLGTVIGITLALENFGTQDIGSKNLNAAMKVLLSGLYIAFDTTALALTLSVLLMFVQFLIDRFETQLLATVDARVAHEMVGRFEETGGSSDPHVRSIERMCRAVVRTTERLVERQGHLWQSTISTAHDRWNNLADTSTQQIQTAISGALTETLQGHAKEVAKVEQDFSEQLRQRWEHWQVVMSDNARVLTDQQKEMVKQTDVMRQVVEATGELMNLQRLLNENLNSLAGAKNFEDTVMSLSAAIHLLTTKLGGTPVPGQRVDLGKPQSQGQAA